MIITEKYIEISESSEYIGIDLPCCEITFSNSVCILVKRFESHNGIIIWRHNIGYGQYKRIVESNIIERFENDFYKKYKIEQRYKKINSL